MIVKLSERGYNITDIVESPLGEEIGEASGVAEETVLTSGINRQKESVDIDQKESGWNDHFQPI